MINTNYNVVVVKKIDSMWHVWVVPGGDKESDWGVPSGHYHKFFEEERNALCYVGQVCTDIFEESQ